MASLIPGISAQQAGLLLAAFLFGSVVTGSLFYTGVLQTPSQPSENVVDQKGLEDIFDDEDYPCGEHIIGMIQ